MNIARPSPHPDLEALLASARLYLLRCAAALIELFGGQVPGALKRFLRLRVNDCERGVEAIIFLMAMARIALPARTRRAQSPAASPPGWRRARTAGNTRRLTRGAVQGAHTGSLTARIERLLSILANPERAIARMIARIRRGLAQGRLVLVAPPAPAPNARAQAAAPARADTS
ncbi:MAG: hypothetical protein WDM79_18925 [Terricaulis sp.]